MTDIHFFKMEGAGNDFVVIDNRDYEFSMEQIIDLTPKICDRKFGIGADGLLVLDNPRLDEVDYTMIYRNADGSDAGMCGNGGRCLALFAAKNGFDTTHQFNVHHNVYKAEVNDEEVSIHFPVHVTPSRKVLEGIHFVQADAATEHLVNFVSEAELEDEEELVKQGRLIRMHDEMNPPGTNVNFVHLKNGESINLQTYERGVENLTLACGTGALASAIASHHYKGSTEPQGSYDIHVKGGRLKASFDFDIQTETYKNLILTGPANFVFEGNITL